MSEMVVLVDTNNKPIGTALKAQVHTSQTPLHRGFSVFLFNNHGQLLLSQRSSIKKTWPGFWSNSVCGHPLPDEDITDAAKRRIKDELGIAVSDPQVMLPDYSYRFEHKGIVENEICPVLVGKIGKDMQPDPKEIQSVKWIDWREWVKEVSTHPTIYSPWSVEETTLLDKNTDFQRFYQNV